MLEVLYVFALLAGTSLAAGYLPVRFLASEFPVSSRMALAPLLGAGLVALPVGWLNFFIPLGERGVLIGLIPVAAGAGLFLFDVFRHNLPRIRKPHIVWGLLSMAGAVLALLPFLLLGEATTCGFTNDGFWWTVADSRVQNLTIGAPNNSADLRFLQRSEHDEFRRYGANYLSVLAQALTGLLSWQVVHLTGAFGLWLLMQAAWLLSRGFHVWWPAAVLVSLAAAGNAFAYLPFVNTVVGFQFGFAYVVAMFAVAMRFQVPCIAGRGAVLALLAASLGVFYTEFLAIAAIAISAGLAGQLVSQGLRVRQIAALTAGALGSVILLGPLMTIAVQHVLFVAAYRIPVTLYDFSWRTGTFLHLIGMMDHQQMIVNAASSASFVVKPVQWIGAGAVLVLFGGAVWNARFRAQSWFVLGSVLFVFYIAFRHFIGSGQQYSAHRITVIMAPFAICLLFGFLHRRIPAWRAWALAAAVVIICGSYPAYRLLREIPGHYIRVTNTERQIGDEWIPNLPRGARLLIDVEEDVRVFNAHYMYWEAARGFKWDESRIVYPAPTYSFVPPTRPESMNTSGVRYVLRKRNSASNVHGRLQPVAVNARYELMRADGDLIWIRYESGFYGLEKSNGLDSRWMGQDARVRVISPGHRTLAFTSGVNKYPPLPPTTLSVTVNGSQTARFDVTDTGRVEFQAPLVPGENTIVFHSTAEPVRISAADPRSVSVMFNNPRATLDSL